jgi:hypothetical protein
VAGERGDEWPSAAARRERQESLEEWRSRRIDLIALGIRLAVWASDPDSGAPIDLDWPREILECAAAIMYHEGRGTEALDLVSATLDRETLLEVRFYPPVTEEDQPELPF